MGKYGLKKVRNNLSAMKLDRESKSLDEIRYSKRSLTAKKNNNADDES
jgi:hypothetical protein